MWSKGGFNKIKTYKLKKRRKILKSHFSHSTKKVIMVDRMILRNCKMQIR